jgi:hypothetical protein
MGIKTTPIFMLILKLLKKCERIANKKVINKKAINKKGAK